MKSIEIIMLPVSDQQKAKQFYTRLGFEVLVEAPMAQGETWIQMALPGQAVSIALMTFHGVIMEVADIDNEIKQLTAKGVEVGKIDNTPWGRFAWMKDGDENSLCLHQK